MHLRARVACRALLSVSLLALLLSSAPIMPVQSMNLFGCKHSDVVEPGARSSGAQSREPSAKGPHKNGRTLGNNDDQSKQQQQLDQDAKRMHELWRDLTQKVDRPLVEPERVRQRLGELTELLKRTHDKSDHFLDVVPLYGARHVQTHRCSSEAQKKLINLSIKYKMTALHDYIEQIRAKYRELCADTLDERVDRQLRKTYGLIVDVETVEKFEKVLGQVRASQSDPSDDLDQVSAATVATSLRLYLADNLPTGDSWTAMSDPLVKEDVDEDYEELKESCFTMVNMFGDFLWIQKLFDQRAELAGQSERMLRLTRICNLLSVDRYDEGVGELYNQVSLQDRQLLGLFVPMLRIKDYEAWPSQEEFDAKVELAVHKMTNGMTVDREELRATETYASVMSDLDRACTGVLDKLGAFTWLGYLEALEGPRSSKAIKTARVCEVFKKRAEASPA